MIGRGGSRFRYCSYLYGMDRRVVRQHSSDIVSYRHVTTVYKNKIIECNVLVLVRISHLSNFFTDK